MEFDWNGANQTLGPVTADLESTTSMQTPLKALWNSCNPTTRPGMRFTTQSSEYKIGKFAELTTKFEDLYECISDTHCAGNDENRTGCQTDATELFVFHCLQPKLLGRACNTKADKECGVCSPINMCTCVPCVVVAGCTC